MILTGVEIEHFKQYGERQTIDIPDQGVVAVFGANGVGKTTLFEAIEWCLYAPSTMKRDDILTRGGVGKPRVAVTLQSRDNGERFRIERWYTARSADAAIYREGQEGAPIVSGAREVTRYVETTLIGLGHRAFVSTFFTRQKELSFFGSETASVRRREVARLLGHDTIRLAQESIAADRKNADAAANAAKRQYADATENRDLAAELDAAARELNARGEALARVEAERTRVSAERQRRRAEFDALRDLQDVHNRVGNEIRVSRSNEAGAQRKIEAITAELARLDASAIRREDLVVLASQGPELRRELDRHERELRKKEQADAARLSLNEARSKLEVLGPALNRIAREHPAHGLPMAAAWQVDPAAHLLDMVEQLLDLVEPFQAGPYLARARELEECLQLGREWQTARTRVSTYQRALAKLRDELAELRSAGDPEAERAAAEQELNRLSGVIAAAEAEARGEDARAAMPREMALKLGRLQLDLPCPTCNRPFTADDNIQETVAYLNQQAEQHRRAAADARTRAAEARTRQQAVERARDDAIGALNKITKLQGRIQNGEQMVREEEIAEARHAEPLQHALRNARLAAPPTSEEVEAARELASAAKTFAAAAPRLRDARERIEDALRAESTASDALETIGAVHYDPTAHTVTRTALQRAGEAAGEVREIETQLQRRPDWERELAAALAELRTLEHARAALEAEQQALGFDPDHLETARAANDQAEAAEKAAVDLVAASQVDRVQAENAWKQIERAVAAAAELETRAIRLEREAADLQRMYNGFTAFDRYVADRVVPVLAERTSEFLAEMTDGKYNRADFDSDYGLRVYDGEEAFPVGGFSGGERDVASLAARLALSTVIGAQAADPPRFVVLDEVFGSLDQDRRSLVLEMLGKLTAESQPLNQLFIISHVEDVNTSPVVDEVWQVRDVHGSSEIRRGEGGLPGSEGL